MTALHIHHSEMRTSNRLTILLPRYFIMFIERPISLSFSFTPSQHLFFKVSSFTNMQVKYF